MISIEFLIVQEDGYHNVSASRVQIAKAFNPKLGLGTLRYENDHLVRENKAIAESVPIYPDGPRTETIQKGLINLICPSPFWEDITPENYKLEDFVGNFRFPFKFPVRFASRGDSRELVNKGDVPTPIKVTFCGESINPKITNLTTGEFIKVNRSILLNYSLVINTEFGNKEVKIVAPDGVEQNAFSYIDLESSFFMLNVGENRFSFITDGGQPEVYIEYRNKYLGV